MTASMPTNPVYSNFTLSILRDTGWYDIVDKN